MASNAPSGSETFPIPASREEEDLLAGSSKKIKNGKQVGIDSSMSGLWPKLGSCDSRFVRGGKFFCRYIN